MVVAILAMPHDVQLPAYPKKIPSHTVDMNVESYGDQRSFVRVYVSCEVEALTSPRGLTCFLSQLQVAI